MSTPLPAQCKDLRLVMDELTVAVSAYSHTSSQSDRAKLLALFAAFMHSLPYPPCSSHSIKPLCWTSLSTAVSQALTDELQLFLPAFSSLVTALVVKLDRSQWVGAGPRNPASDFRALWTLLLSTCTFSNWFLRHGPLHHGPASAPLYPALHSLMHFLLQLQCPCDQQPPWLCSLGQAVTTAQASAMLMPVLYAMTNIAADRSARSLPAPLVSLPPTFISTLCYLVCETLDRRRQDDVSVTGVLEELCMNLSVFVSQALQTGKEGSGVPFRHLAVLEVAKRGVIALQHRSYDTAVDSRELLGMLCLGGKYALVEGSDASGCSSRTASNSTTASPALVHMQPSVTVPELKVLCVMCKDSAAGEHAAIEYDCCFMLRVVEVWPDPIPGNEVLPHALDNISSMFHIARFCALYTGGRMQQQRQQQRRLRRRQHVQISPRPEASVAPLSTHFSQSVFGVMLMLCLHASHFQLPGMTCWTGLSCGRIMQLPGCVVQRSHIVVAAS